MLLLVVTLIIVRGVRDDAVTDDARPTLVLNTKGKWKTFSRLPFISWNNKFSARVSTWFFPPSTLLFSPHPRAFSLACSRPFTQSVSIEHRESEAIVDAVIILWDSNSQPWIRWIIKRRKSFTLEATLFDVTEKGQPRERSVWREEAKAECSTARQSWGEVSASLTFNLQPDSTLWNAFCLSSRLFILLISTIKDFPSRFECYFRRQAGS